LTRPVFGDGCADQPDQLQVQRGDDGGNARVQTHDRRKQTAGERGGPAIPRWHIRRIWRQISAAEVAGGIRRKVRLFRVLPGVYIPRRTE